ncbi:NAD(P)-dependent oxidoreductase [Rhodoplanes elegans]|uniref:NAD(P)-dependent oxidoreductase n=1 Tax=Rhodoplanes elegans TaxID=29408 RepID=A0A327KBU7_9BRAD|nr:NmrA family NAD(P)-binding protein [Rhodoplanes elegans]MBK5962080.1 NAD(P)-dependent oxidoreductase [Rhodoplanes elegans]RAI35857.1 NAD(P)-dependent oxidoreductase [Rhodoplanes elegans]
MSDALLVTGASGHLGRRVLHHLVESLAVPPGRIVATSRKPDALAAFANKGVTVRAADFEDAASLDKAFAGVGRLLLISTDTLDRPGARLAQHQAAVAAAEKAGVRHVVYTSMPLPENSPILFAPDHLGTEQALAASRLPGFTVLRNHWYFENLAHALPAALASGHWYSAAAGGGYADIARDDLARAAATVLAGSETGRHTYTLSGAEALTRDEIAAKVSAALGKPLAVVPVTIDALVAGMVAHGVPEPIARVFASFDAAAAAGRFAHVTDDYFKITGRRPQSFDAWLAANKTILTGEH